MKPRDLKSMSADDLRSLHERVVSVLARKMSAEKARLDQKLRQLSGGAEPHKMSHARRPYPKVFPKFRNPAEPSETWAGRGKKPRWLTAQLKSGKKIDDLQSVIQTSKNWNLGLPLQYENMRD
jgi:DNA-binding protein H-NS